MYSMLSTPEAASDVFFDPQDGVLAGLSEGKSLVDCATLQVEVRERVRTSLLALLCVLPAPISSGRLRNAISEWILASYGL